MTHPAANFDLQVLLIRLSICFMTFNAACSSSICLQHISQSYEKHLTFR